MLKRQTDEQTKLVPRLKVPDLAPRVNQLECTVRPTLTLSF